MIYSVTLNPALDKTVAISGFTLDAVNRITSIEKDAGGKGINVSRWVHTLGGSTVALGVLGGASGHFIADALSAEGIPSDFVWVQADTRTNLKIIDPEENTHTDINEPGEAVDTETLTAVFDRLTSRALSGDIAVLAGRNPPGTPADLPADWILRLKALGIKVYVDMDGPMLAAAISQSPHLIKPNRVELEEYLGRPLPTVDSVVNAARALLSGGIHRVVVSLGEAGALFAQADRILLADGLCVPVGSTVGAGDATLAAMAYGEAVGLAFTDTARLAIAAGAASVMQPGTKVAPQNLVKTLAERVHLHDINS